MRDARFPEGFAPIITVGSEDGTRSSLTVYMHDADSKYGDILLRLAATLGMLYQEALNQPPYRADKMATFDEYWTEMGKVARRAADMSLIGDVEKTHRQDLKYSQARGYERDAEGPGDG